MERSNFAGTSSNLSAWSRFEVAGRTRLDARVAGLLDQHGQPAHLELGARRNHQVGAAGTRDQAGLGFDTVHVLQRGGGDVHVDAVTAQLLRQRTPVGRGGQHLERGLRGNRAALRPTTLQRHESGISWSDS